MLAITKQLAPFDSGSAPPNTVLNAPILKQHQAMGPPRGTPTQHTRPAGRQACKGTMHHSIRTNPAAAETCCRGLIRIHELSMHMHP